MAEINGRLVWTVDMAATVTGAEKPPDQGGGEEGDIELIAVGGCGGGRHRWLVAAEDVIAWHRASRPPGPIPADPLGLALDGSLRIALDRDLALRALERLERERRRLRAERLAVQEARVTRTWPGR